MAIIMRSSGQKRGQDNKVKQIYTWVGCGLVIILTLVGIFSTMKEERKPEYNQFSSKMQDLAALPFGTDAEAGNFLRNNSEYVGLSNAELLGSLFSAEDRQERQAKDKAEGVPPPPDPEYKAIADNKEKVEKVKALNEARVQKQTQEREQYNKELKRIQEKAQNKNTKNTKQAVRNQNPATKPGTLSSGKMAGGGSAGASGTVGSTWRYEDKNIKTGANNSAPANHALNAQDIAFAKNQGRAVGLDVATIESLKGANATSLEGAAAGAIDAFQGEVAAEDLEKDEQELGLDELPQGVNAEVLDDLKRELGQDLNKQASNNKSSNTLKSSEYTVNENCMGSDGKISSACVGMKILFKAIDTVFDVGKSLASGWASTWSSGSSKSGGSNGVSNYTIVEGNDHHKYAVGTLPDNTPYRHCIDC